MIIDVHTHIGPFGESVGRSAEELIASMDDAGIDISLVIASYFGKQKRGLTIKQLIGEAGRFTKLKVIGNFDYESMGDKQISYLGELIKNKLIVGIKCYCGYEYYYPNDEKLYPLYRLCSDHNIPIIYHTGFILPGSQGLLKYSHPLNIDEVATAFPALKIIIAHFGSPWIADCAAVVAKNKNVYADISGQFTNPQSISKEEEVDFIKDILTFKSLSDSCKIMFGTDWWFYSQKECLRVTRNLPVSKDENDLILWKNAKNIFNL